MDRCLGDMTEFLTGSIPYPGMLLTDLTPHLEKGFLHPLRTGAVFHLQHETKPGYLMLTIVTRQDKWLQVEYGLPDDYWSHERFDQVQAAMLDAGHPTYMEEQPGDNRIRRFLRVYIRGNWNEITPTLLQVLQLAAKNLGFEDSDRYSMRLAGVASYDYMEEIATNIDEKLNRSPRGRGCLGALLSSFFHGAAKLYDDRDH